MKTLFKNTIIRQAIELGFDFDQFANDASLQEVNDALIDFFNENSEKLPQLEDECKVTNNRGTQHISYGDFWCDGEIIDLSANWHKEPGTKILCHDFVMEDTDGLMINMNLYFLVSENEFNAPDGYVYSKEIGGHVKIEEENA